MSDERIKRPQPERTQPFRSWSTILGDRPPRAGAANGGPADAAAAPAGATGASNASAGAAASASNASTGGAQAGPTFNDVVARSVDIGYRVIDEYIRQGQRAAQRISDRSFGPDAVVTDMRDVADRMARHASDVMGLWFQLLDVASSGNAMTGMMMPFGTAAPPPFGSPAASTSAAAPVRHGPDAPPPADRVRVAIEVLSPYPTEVSIDARPGASMAGCAVHSLRATDPEKPRLTDVRLEPGDASGAMRLRIAVPAGQPAGVYSGLVVEEQTSRPVATVTVRIAAS